MKIEFWVPGIPRPGGSKRAFPIRKKDGTFIKMGVADANPKVKEWRSDVINACQKVFSGPPLMGPLKFEVIFVLPYRMKDFKTGRNAWMLKDCAPKYCMTKPDGLKLRRSTEDALTGILYRDDAQIVDGHDKKIYGFKPGAMILVEGLEGKEISSKMNSIKKREWCMR